MLNVNFQVSVLLGAGRAASWILAAMLLPGFVLAVEPPVVAATGKGTEGKRRTPNVLFIVSDDLHGHLAPAGYPGIKTPVLDAMAKESVTFRRNYCQYPVCGPSRASIMSGLYPESTRVLDNSSRIETSRPGTTSFPMAFRQAGYWTACVGKVFHRELDNPGGDTWDVTTWNQDDEMPIERRAREVFEAANGPISDPKNKKAWASVHYALAPQTRDQGVHGTKGYGIGPTGMADELHNDAKDARQVVRWITSEERGDRPFMIACGFHRPHIPLTAPDAYFDLYPRESLVFDHDSLYDWFHRPLIAMPTKPVQPGLPPYGNEDVERRRNETQAYAACVSFLDAQLGLIFETLRQQGLWDDTIIVFIGDHGYHLGEHFMYGKVMLFEESNSTPLIIRVPGLTKGGISVEFTELIDIFPTLAELCSLKAPSHLQGTSLVPVLRDIGTSGKGYAYTVVAREGGLGRALRFDRWRYTEWPSELDRELYDLEVDPRERKNLAWDPAYATIVLKAHELLAQVRRNAESQRVDTGK